MFLLGGPAKIGLTLNHFPPGFQTAGCMAGLAKFGDEVAELIDGVTKLDRIRFSSREEHQAATIRKMAIAMARDIRVLLIKLADRLHNVRTLAPLPEAKRQRIARETIEVYAPLAHRLGMSVVCEGVEDAETFAWLREAGADLVQGYHTGKPMRAAEFRAYLEVRSMPEA